MTRLRALLGATVLLGLATAADAQNSYESVGGATVPTAVEMCLNSSGKAVPIFNAAGTWQCSGATIPVAVDTSLLATAAKQDTTNTDLGAPGATACATDTGSCSINALLQRLAQRLSTLITGPLPVTLPTTPTVAAGNGVVPVSSAESGAGITPVVSATLESNHVIKASAGNLYSAYITTGAVAGWFLVANATSAPTAGGAAIAPLVCVVAPINSTTSISYPDNAPLVASTGITLVFSTSGCLTNTASATAFFSGSAK